jgi:hypothetical protein
MRTVQALVVVAMSTVGIVTSAASASAASMIAMHPNGDFARWDQASNVMTVCDQSQANGTAKGILQVVTGNTKELFDTNGAQPGCNVIGPLNVDDNKQAYLSVCPDGSGYNCRTIGPFWL